MNIFQYVSVGLKGVTGTVDADLQTQVGLSSQQPLTHSVSDIERQPLSGAPRGQILATYVALLGYVFIWSKYLWGREESEYPRLGQEYQGWVTMPGW